MTTVTLTSSDSRHAKAILITADSGQWLRPNRPIAGRRAVGIPSQTKRGLYHWTDGVTCSCYDFRRRQLPCKHVFAYKLDAIAREPEQPASNVVDGLTTMLEQRQVAAPLHFHDDRYLGTACAMPFKGRAHTTDVDAVTCEQCKQILSSRAQMAREVADGTFWNRFK
jgi:hypothetical protein